MSISSVTRIKTVANQLNADDNSIVTIYENTGLTVGNELIADHKIVSFNCFIKNLRAFALIESLAEASLPNFELTDSETDKLYKTLAIEWGSARKQITLYISNQANASPNGDGWFKVGSISLLNPSGYPYRIYNLMDVFTDSLAIELGDNGKVGVQVENVGFGLLDTTDTVTIHGSYLEEIFVQTPDVIYVPSTGSNGGSNSAAAKFPIDTLFRISASDIQLSNEQLVATWQQPGTSNLIVTQEAEMNQPVFRTNVLNGKSAVHFDGTSKFLTVKQIANSSESTFLIPSRGDWLVFLVAKFDDPITYGFSAFDGNETFNPNISIGGSNSILGSIDPYNGYNEITVSYSPNASWNIYFMRRQGDLITLYINGATYFLGNKSSAIAPFSYYLDEILIGCAGNNYLNGYIADIGILSNHSVSDINAIGTYFRNLYNLTWINI